MLIALDLDHYTKRGVHVNLSTMLKYELSAKQTDLATADIPRDFSGVENVDLADGGGLESTVVYSR